MNEQSNTGGLRIEYAVPVPVYQAEPVWEVEEVVVDKTSATGRRINKITIPVPKKDELSMAQEAYLLSQSPAYANQSFSSLLFLVKKAQSMGLSAIKGDVSLIEGRVAPSDGAKTRPVLTKVIDLEITEPTSAPHPVLCACGHPKIFHKGAGCAWSAELRSGTKKCSCKEPLGRDMEDMYIEVSGKLVQGGKRLGLKTWLSEWYNSKNDAWVNYTADRFTAKALARFGERFCPIGEDADQFVEPELTKSVPTDTIAEDLRLAISEGPK